MKKKVSIGSWAYVFGPYEDDPVPLDTVMEELNKMNFDGISLAGFKPHAHLEDYETKADKKRLLKMLKDNNLEVAEYVPDFWGLNPLTQTDEYKDLFERNLQFMVDCGFEMMRVDTGTEPKLPAGMSYDTAYQKVVDIFGEGAKTAAKEGIKIVWEFEPGFIFNKPSEILGIYEAVDEDNFEILFDTCHANMCGVIGARQMGEKETLDGGVVEFAEMLKDKIGMVHLIDSDNTLHGGETSTHAPFGQGVLDFDEIIPALLDKANYTEEWWTIDLCFWEDAWEVTRQSKEFVDEINEKYCSE